MDRTHQPQADTVGSRMAGRYASLEGSDCQALGLAILQQCTRLAPADRDGRPLPPRRPAER